ncbi:MAG TPA: biotin transporter BioY [Leptolyngbyaceae cyanobacterium M65_K2018_010]|nr:biotin transporter BioY [Leptolyngbyaceae cyanobacterium M65_K2018_010]
MFAPFELLWALIGLVLTIVATWMEVFTINPPWNWGQVGVVVLSLGVSFQVGAVLLTGCVGGKNAAALSQIAYLVLGLALFRVFEFPVFTQGGGLSYVREPGFGYLLGFVPGGWLCGYLAFQEPPKLESLAFSSLWGLGVIHACGLVYLTLASLLGWLHTVSASYWELVLSYSIFPLPGQLMVVCAVAVLSLGLRHLLFY